jgi:hypothetical protein
MKTSITLRGRITITYLRNGNIRIEGGKPRGLQRAAERVPFEELRTRPRMHVRGDEFLRLIHSVARPRPQVIAVPAERFGAL